MILRKVKRPGGDFSFDEVDLLVEDDTGVWLHGAKGTRWTAPHAVGVTEWEMLIHLDVHGR